MPKTQHVAPSRAIGRVLKDWRTDRGFTLRHVALASEAHPEPISFDYLSRLERGQLMPSVPKLATLAAVYERPLNELVDLYEIEEVRKLVPRRVSYEVCCQLGAENLERGRITKALACFLGAIDVARREGAEGQRLGAAYNHAAGAMIRAGRYLTARVYLEEGLRVAESDATRALLLDSLAIVHHNLGDLFLAGLLSRESSGLAAGNPAPRPAVRTTRSTILTQLEQYEEAEPPMREAIPSP